MSTKHKPREVCREIYARESDGKEFRCGAPVYGACQTCKRRGIVRAVIHTPGGRE